MQCNFLFKCGWLELHEQQNPAKLHILIVIEFYFMLYLLVLAQLRQDPLSESQHPLTCQGRLFKQSFVFGDIRVEPGAETAYF